MGVIQHLSGVLVHDGWSSYRKYTAVSHALCNAQYEEPAIMQNELAGFPFVPA